MRLKIKWKVFLLALAVCLLPACGAGGEKREEGVPTLIYATLSGQVDREMVDGFNAEHEGEIQIKVVDYSEGVDEGGRQGMDRLLTEIAAGKCPDILETFTYTGNYSGKINALPYQQMAKKGYLENLWPYIENDPELGRDSVLEAPLKAAEVDGGLYMLFSRFAIRTLAGAPEVVGDRYSWSLDELWKSFSAMPENATILDYTDDKSTVFGNLFPMLVASYIDWESGQCSFDSKGFRSSLEFINSFPQEFAWTSDEEVNRELCQRQMKGLQMLNSFGIWTMRDMQVIDSWCGGRASFVGYPTADGSTGSFFSIQSGRLAMSPDCKNKEAAWDFLRRMLLSQYTPAESEKGLPVNKASFQKQFERDSEPESTYRAMVFGFYGPTSEFPPLKEEDYDRLVDFIDRIDKIGIYDQELLDIIQESCDPYFAGDKDLDETVELIQNRMKLYVNERR